MKKHRIKSSRKITALLSAIMLTEQLTSTGAILAHAEDVPPAEYAIEHNVTSAWDGGCTAEIILTNQAEADTESWSVTFCTRDKITSLWGGKITECEELLVSDASVEMDDAAEEDTEEESDAVEDTAVETESEETASEEAEIEDVTGEEGLEEVEEESAEDSEDDSEEESAEETEEKEEDLTDAVEEDIEEALEEELLDEELLEEEILTEELEEEAEEESEEEDNLYYRYTVEALDYNAVIPAGGSTTIGYNANGEVHEIWDEQAEFTYAAKDVIDESMSNEKGVSNDQIEDTTYLFEGDDYAVRYTVKSHWEGFCNVEIAIENRSDVKMDNWNLTFYTEDEIRNVYNAQIVVNDSEQGRVTLKNSGYNQDIPANGSVSFGFEVAYGEHFDRPEAFCLGNEEAIVPENEYIYTNSIQSEWDEGCIGAINIQNISTEAIEDWSLIIYVDGSISSVWGGNLKEIGDGLYEIECPDHSQNILVGGNVTIGYQAAKNTEITVVELRERNAGLNGQGTTVSGNGAHYTNNDGKEQRIFIESDSFQIEAISVYSVYEDVTNIHGYTNYGIAFEAAEIHIEDLYGDTVWEGEITSTDGYKTWSVEDFGLILGGNILVFTLIDADDNEYEEVLCIVNYEKSNMSRTMIELVDTDADEIYDYYEKYYGTDPENADTDGDTLKDGIEVNRLYLDPTKEDSDGDGILDPDEDNDEDGLDVVREYEIGTTDWCEDSDIDGLEDGYEVNTLGTDPLKEDTDGDGFTDKEEVDLGMNPLSTDSDGDGVPDAQEIITQTSSYKLRSEDSAVKDVSVDIGCQGSTNGKVHIYENGNTIIANTPGIIGKPVEIDVDTTFDSAQIKFSYDESMLGDTQEENLKLMWYNEADDEYVLLEDSVCDPNSNTVTYTTNHFSTYFIIDWFKWKEYRTEPIDYTDYTKTIKENYDFIVFMDYTVSKEELATEEKIASSIIAQMEDGDRILFYYVVKDNLKMMTEKYGAYVWSTTKEQALKYMNPNTANPLAMFMSGGMSTSGEYNGRADLSIEAINYPAGSGRKKVAYLFYPGTAYDSTFQKYSSDMATQTTKAAAAGSVLYAIPLDGTPSAELHQYISKLGGEQYVGNDVTVMDAIENNLSQRIELLNGQENLKDTDGDGLLDVWETKGMRASNGWVVYSDPNDLDGDTDGDGYSDSEEVGIQDKTTGNFRVYSDPSDPNSTPVKPKPMYIIVWSYGGEKDIPEFKKWYNSILTVVTICRFLVIIKMLKCMQIDWVLVFRRMQIKNYL